MKTLKIIVAIFAAAALAGCGAITNGKAASDRAIARYHALYNQGKLDDIWNEANPVFRSTSAKQKYDELVDAVRRKLGKVSSTSTVRWNVQSFNLKTTVYMTQNTVFEQGKGTESFTFAMEGTNAVLQAYNIQSLDLITK